MSKKILIVVMCFLSAKITTGQSIFKTIKVPWQGDTAIERRPIRQQDARYFGITLAKDTNAAFMYPLVSDLVPSFDTLTAIKELLAYKGDTRICGTPVRGYCLICSSTYMGGKYYYSLQVQALYIINQLVYDPKIIHNPFPVLYDLKSGKDITVDEGGISRLFDSYIKWYDSVKHMTMAEIRKSDRNPYREAEVRWAR